MMTETNLAQSIESTEGLQSSYDSNAKHLLADKQILARILKYAVSEFSEMSLEEIMSSIGNEIEIGTRPVDPGLTNLGRVHGTSTESNVPHEGKIYFDICFSAYIKKEEMKILINVEAQRSTDPSSLGYHIENRMLFYMARMISAQKQVEFVRDNYDDLKRVRSIWICMDAERNDEYIEEFSLVRHAAYGKNRTPYRLDLMKGIIIHTRLQKDISKSKNKLIAMLEYLFSSMNAESKKQVLEQEYGMKMSIELEGRVNDMCNISQAIKEIGIEEGRTQGRLQERMSLLKNLIKNGVSREQIMAIGFTEEEIINVDKA